MRRQIIGKIYQTDDTPYGNVAVTFVRSLGSYTSQITYPPDSIKCQVNAAGELVNCFLWVNESGDKISNYTAYVKGDKFSFSIPSGDGSPIELSVLRSGSQPTETYPQSILDYIDAKIATVGGEALKVNFSQANIAGDYLDIEHNFGSYPLVQIFAGAHQINADDIIQLTLNSTRISVVSYLPLQGNWLAILSK